jgi:endonuclease I
MFQIIFTLFIAGIFSGLVQYFVDFKKLPLYSGAAGANNGGFAAEKPPGRIAVMWLFIKQHWEFFGYMIIGIAGAFLTPVIDKLIVNLDGLDSIKAFATCVPAENAPCRLGDKWQLLILFGYGIIFGYSAVRIIRSVGLLILGNVSQKEEELKKRLETAEQEKQALMNKIPAPGGPVPGGAAGAAAGGPPPGGPPAGFLAALNGEGRLDVYFNEARNEEDKRSYYAGIDMNAPATLYDALHKKLSGTHLNQLPYKPSHHLYPVVDRYKDGLLRSIYSGKTFDLPSLLEMDRQVDEKRAMAFSRLARNGFTADAYKKGMERIENKLPYNCEHVVPQSWFGKKDPMKGDLHHLFTCEIICNQVRDNQPYTEFPDYEGYLAGLIREGCGKAESQLFEPEFNKGIVARAVLYFLVRYPAAFVDGRGYTAADIPMLLDWHMQHGVTEYELHRNQAIFQAQGNRNPFIDYPEIAGLVQFSEAFPSIDMALTEA